jgi:hypothetical protein
MHLRPEGFSGLLRLKWLLTAADAGDMGFSSVLSGVDSETPGRLD